MESSADIQLRELRYPVELPPRLLLAGAPFRHFEELRYSPLDGPDWAAMDPDTIAAPVSVLRRLVRWPRTLRYPIVALSGGRWSYLSEDDRDAVWEAFQVPVFEYLVGPSGHILAEECEAHDGLHILTSGEPFLPHAPAQINSETCGCGRTEPRLMNLDRFASAKVAVGTTFA